jgi:hypothetical protein
MLARPFPGSERRGKRLCFCNRSESVPSGFVTGELASPGRCFSTRTPEHTANTATGGTRPPVAETNGNATVWFVNVAPAGQARWRPKPLGWTVYFLSVRRASSSACQAATSSGLSIFSEEVRQDLSSVSASARRRAPWCFAIAASIDLRNSPAHFLTAHFLGRQSFANVRRSEAFAPQASFLLLSRFLVEADDPFLRLDTPPFHKRMDRFGPF